MGVFSRIIEGREHMGELPREYLARLAERGRAGHFTPQAQSPRVLVPLRIYDVEEVAPDARGGYRDSPRAPAVHLRARPGNGSGFLDDVRLEVDEAGAIRYRIRLTARQRFFQLVPIAFLLLVGVTLGLSVHRSSAAILVALPILVMSLVSFFTTSNRVGVGARNAIRSALANELANEHIDASLEGSNAYRGRANEIVALLEARAIVLSTDERARILECDDIVTIEEWRRRALTAASTSDLFDGPKLRVATDVAAPSTPASALADAGDLEDEDAKRDTSRTR
ncbi:hypothetical protein BH09MYX1_BH09MYX1_57140 [soil metagenome]